jgi:hypothetical protein
LRIERIAVRDEPAASGLRRSAIAGRRRALRRQVDNAGRLHAKRQRGKEWRQHRGVEARAGDRIVELIDDTNRQGRHGDDNVKEVPAIDRDVARHREAGHRLFPAASAIEAVHDVVCRIGDEHPPTGVECDRERLPIGIMRSWRLQVPAQYKALQREHADAMVLGA